ncbi:DNA polymerase III subunit gamma/tau [Patescibacteria group bacterium]
MGIALYRKYRPSQFKDVIGQTAVITTLKNALEQDRIAHAYLFAGPRGTGKTSVARLLAKAANCPDTKSGEVCGKCTFCTEVEQGRALDLIEIDAASNRGIDEIRALREKVSVAPTNNKYKIYIVDEAHMLTNEAFNALLKTLEEPPAHVIFVLATTEPEKLPVTIQSRTQRYDFKKITLPDLVDHLQGIADKEKTKISKDALEQIARKGEGSVRDSLSLLDQIFSSASDSGEISIEHVQDILGLTDLGTIFDLLEALASKNQNAALAVIQQIIDYGHNFAHFEKTLLETMRHLMLWQINPDLPEFTQQWYAPDQLKRLESLANTFSPAELTQLITKFIGTQKLYRTIYLPQLPLEMFIVQFFLDSTGRNNGSNDDSVPSAPGPASKKLLPKAKPKSAPAKSAIKIKTKEINNIKPLKNVSVKLKSIVARWDEVVKHLSESNVTTAQVLKSSVPVQLEKNRITLIVERDFYKDYLSQTHQSTRVSETIENIFDANLACSYMTSEEAPPALQKKYEQNRPTVDDNPENPGEMTNNALEIIGGKMVS